MNQRLTLIEDDDEEGFEIELDWLVPRLPWYKRLWYWLTRRTPPEVIFELTEEEEREVEDEFNKRVVVAECIEAALASCAWANRTMEKEAPGWDRFYVVGMGIRDHGNGEFWLYVKVQPAYKYGIEPFFMPLHEFLEQCYPVGDLTFSDYHS